MFPQYSFDAFSLHSKTPASQSHWPSSYYSATHSRVSSYSAAVKVFMYILLSAMAALDTEANMNT